MKKPNRKKKEYIDDDVNGFLEYLKQTGQPLPKGEKKGREEDQDVREEVATALIKDRRRDNRRIKRQKDKKNNMVRTGHLQSIFYLSTEYTLFLSLLTYVDLSPCFFVYTRYVLTAGSLVTVWLTVQRPTEMRRWAEESATDVAPQNMKSRGAELKWTLLWVSTTWILTAGCPQVINMSYCSLMSECGFS